MKISSIILAAGESRRMGDLKQLLPFGEKTVIETVLDKFLQVEFHEIIVVLGYCAEEIHAKLGKYPIKVVVNEKYGDGMLSSVQCGIEYSDELTEAFMIGLCDQPFIEPYIISTLIDHFNTKGKGIILPDYNGKRGHPIIIHSKYRGEIFELDHNIGLRQLIHSHEDDISIVEFDSNIIVRDMDFPEDYKRELRVLKR